MFASFVFFSSVLEAGIVQMRIVLCFAMLLHCSEFAFSDEHLFNGTTIPLYVLCYVHRTCSSFYQQLASVARVYALALGDCISMDGTVREQ